VNNRDRIVIIDSFIPQDVSSELEKLIKKCILSDIDIPPNPKGEYLREKLDKERGVVHTWPTSIINDTDNENSGLYNVLKNYIPSIGTEIEKNYSCSAFQETHFTVTVYKIGESLAPHYDSQTARYPLEEKTPNGHRSRDISSVLYINDDYIGGEINFKWGVKMKPRKGSLILFPTSEKYVHYTDAIVSGTKCVVPQFWCVE
jgi:hypothetical protein